MGRGEEQSRRRKAPVSTPEKEILFSTINYLIIGVGLLLVIIGFFVMSGGHNAPDEWKAEVIYSDMRITLAPIIILTGLGVVVFAIFKDSKGDRIELIQQNKEEEA